MDLWYPDLNSLRVSGCVTMSVGLGALMRAQVVFPHPVGPTMHRTLAEKSWNAKYSSSNVMFASGGLAYSVIVLTASTCVRSQI